MKFFLSVMMSAILLGCGGPSPSPSPSPSGSGEGGAVDSEATKEQALNSLDSLAGVTWVLRAFSAGEPAPAVPAVTLEWRDGSLVGTSGCNRYTTTPTLGAVQGEIRLEAIAGTRMMCPPEQMEIESRYLAALGSVRRYEHTRTELHLAWEREGEGGTLVFEPTPQESP